MPCTKLKHLLPHIVSFVCWMVLKTFQIYSFRTFQGYSRILSIAFTVQYSIFEELIQPQKLKFLLLDEHLPISFIPNSCLLCFL